MPASQAGVFEHIKMLYEVESPSKMRGKVSFDTVRKLGLQLPGVEESTAFGKPSLKVHGKMFVCMASHKSAEPESLVVRTDLEQRAELLAAVPETYYITDHYREYSAVLVRLPRVTPGALRDLLGMAHRFVIGENSRKRKSAPSRGRLKRTTRTG